MSRFLGITREAVFSPGRVSDDSAILHAVARRLDALGHEVTVVSGEADPWPDPTGMAAVFVMCQGSSALDRLRRWQQQGIRIINSPTAILNCQRHRTVAVLAGSDIPFPESRMLATSAIRELPPWVARDGAWIKRGDVHATEPDDVVFAADAGAAAEVFERFGQRGIATVLVQRHVPGTVLKFYAVRQRFFHCVRPPGMDISAAVLQRITALAEQAARRLELEIFGGDCIFGRGGELVLIDLNEWPSYAACRAEAADEIAGYLLARETATQT
jgi:glutathione synthase/RimK-type ligase-like ATP-grasp enzyme